MGDFNNSGIYSSSFSCEKGLSVLFCKDVCFSRHPHGKACTCLQCYVLQLILSCFFSYSNISELDCASWFESIFNFFFQSSSESERTSAFSINSKGRKMLLRTYYETITALISRQWKWTSGSRITVKWLTWDLDAVSSPSLLPGPCYSIFSQHAAQSPHTAPGGCLHEVFSLSWEYGWSCLSFSDSISNS